MNQSVAGQLTFVGASKDTITLRGRSESGSLSVAELAPYQTANDLANTATVVETTGKGKFQIKIPRWDGKRDRLYSGFLICSTTNSARSPQGEIHYVEDMQGVAKYNEPFPQAASKKGLQVQMVDDAIALGVKHAAFNVNISQIIDLSSNANSPTWELDGVTYYFNRGAIEGLDHEIKTLSDRGVTITLILLCYQSGNPALDAITLHPHYSPNAPHHLSAFNTLTPDGLRYFQAGVEFLTERYSQPGYPHGRAVNFIVGNEVNSHWEWANLGEATMEEFADDYLRTVRVCATAVHKINASSRVYVSLEHHWNIRYGDPNPKHSFAARRFVDYFNRRAREGGDFDWNIAFHPYPEDLNEPRTWNDKSATLADDTPRITFKNIQMLPLYLQRPELLHLGHPRRIILSEQGFNTPQKPDGELWQAAAYCYAWYKINQLPGIDAFILHRHVDHRDEGLDLGLWRRNLSSPQASEPSSKKKIYEVFRLADTPEWREAFAFALPVIGIQRWEDLSVKTPVTKKSPKSKSNHPPFAAPKQS